MEVGFFLLYKEQPQNFISSLRLLYACKNITMETPKELYDYFMQIPSELKEEITRELNQDANTYLLPKVKQMARECAIKTLKRLSVGIKKNTIDPGKKTHLIRSNKTTTKTTQLAHTGQHPEIKRLLKAGSLFKIVRATEDQKDTAPPPPVAKYMKCCGKWVTTTTTADV